MEHCFGMKDKDLSMNYAVETIWEKLILEVLISAGSWQQFQGIPVHKCCVLLTEGKLQGPMQVWKIALGKFSHVRPSKTVMYEP